MSEPGQQTVLGSLLRFRWLALAIVAGVTLLSIAVGLLLAPSVQATATIALTTPPSDAVLSPGSQGDSSLARYTAQRARFMTSDAVLVEVAQRLGEDDVTDLRERVRATPSGTSNVVVVTAEADTDRRAVEVAQTVVDVYRLETEAQVDELTQSAIDSIDQAASDLVSSVEDDSTEALSSATGEALAQLRLQASDLLTDQALFGDGVEFVNEARIDAVTEPGLPAREAALGLLLGLVLAATVTWLRADRDAGVTEAEQLEGLLGAPNFGVLHAAKPLGPIPTRALDDYPGHDYRLVWSALIRQVPKGVIVVGSDGAGWRSTAALHLAMAAARDELEVLLVDADLTSGHISHALGDGIRPTPGLSGVLASGATWRKAVTRVVRGDLRTLSVLQAGTDSPHDIRVSTMQIETLVDEWRASYDLVLIDTESVDASQLTAMFYGASDGVLVLVDEGADERRVAELRRNITLQGAPVIGGVLATAN